jgi:L-ascorbate metabolism protein UlaG (beta-lactamase superfamily)
MREAAGMADRLTWLGHASVLLELAGARMLTDPLLRGRVAHLRRQVPPAVAPRGLDAILISHLHRDHLDVPSVAALDRDAVVLAPRGGAHVLRRSGREVIELAAGDEWRTDDASVLAVPAVHESRRDPWGPTTDALGFVVVAAGRRVYFAGDTECFPGMTELTPLDLALVPIWGWGPTLGPGHMDPEQAAEAVALLRPEIAVPIHWGTYLPIGTGRRYAAALVEPPRRFARRCAVLAPETVVRALQPGGSLPLGAVSTHRQRDDEDRAGEQHQAGEAQHDDPQRPPVQSE